MSRYEQKIDECEVELFFQATNYNALVCEKGVPSFVVLSDQKGKLHLGYY